MAERDQIGPGAVAADGAADDGTEVSEDKPKGKGRFLMILIPLILLGAGGGGVVAYSQYTSIATMGYEAPATEEEEEEEPIDYGEFMEMESLIINPAGTDGTRYLMIKIGLESKKAKALEEVREKAIVLRDAILRDLSARTVDELAAIEHRNQIKEDLREVINGILEKGEVTRLYFTQYVLQ